MTILNSPGAFQSCACCAPRGVSRRQFLCTSAAAVAAAPTLAAVVSPAAAQQPSTAVAPGRPILIKNGCVVSLDRAVGDFEQADVLVRGSKIAEIRPNISATDAEVIDASHSIVMPGFVDTHRHMWQGILRNIIPDASLQEYFKIVQRTLGPAYTPDDLYISNYVSALGAIDVGITNILDWSHIQNTPDHTDAAIKALTDSGVRAVFAYGNPANGLPQFWDDPRQKYPEDIVRLRKQFFSSGDQLVTLALASLGGPQDRLAKAWAVARDVGARITIHAGIGALTKDMLQKIGDAGLMKDDTTYIHCCTLSDSEWKLIRDTGGTVSVAGYVELLMGHGTPPIQKILDMGMRPSLSIDVETSVPGDIFNQMRTVFSLQRGQIWDRSLKGEKDLPAFLKVRDVMEFATIEGAKANGLDSKIGTLTPGKEADLILLRTDRFNVMPMNNAVGAVVTSMGPSNVDTVMIGGQIKKRNGQLVGVDLDSVAKRVNEARERVVALSKYDRAKF
ncbi:MAG: amidohydrolase family protein [Xanthobacteraceae bacterium]